MAEVLQGRWGYANIGDKIADEVLSTRRGRLWWAGFIGTGAMTLGFVGAMAYLFAKGPGIWGIDIPVAWGFAIANCVWWIGIGHAGTFISAVLLLLRQRWRTSINRFAEAMTLFAAAMAGLFPILHLGRPWFFYWLAPYPNRMDLWPQWRSPLVWDFFAIATYLIVSLLFWYLGLIPDLATLRDRAHAQAQRWKAQAFGLFALGWRGEARQWAAHQSAYLMLAGLATPLVVSVHSVVSLDFAIGNTPGWHSTIFPPFFVAGALYSGFAMVLVLAVPLRRFFHLHDLITEVHLDHAAKVMLACAMLVAYGYANEAFMAFYSGDRYEIAITVDRWTGAYAGVYWGMLACNVLSPQLLWWRRHAGLLFTLGLVINLGMWMERVMIVVSSLAHDYMPSAWHVFVPTLWDWAFLLGSIATFVWLFLCFVRLLPAISIAEMRALVHEETPP